MKHFTVALHDQAQEQEIKFLLIIFINKNHFKKGKYETNVILRNLLIPKFQRNILLWHDQTQEHEFGCFYTMSIHKNHFKKQKYGTESV